MVFALQICDIKLLDAASRGKKEVVKALVEIKANVKCTGQVSRVVGHNVIQRIFGVERSSCFRVTVQCLG